MEEKYNDATKNRPEGDRPIDATAVVIDLPQFIHQIKDEKAWDKNDRNAITVFKSDKLRIVLVAMHADAVMQTQHPDNIFSVQVIDGKINLETNGKSVSIKEDELFVLHAGIPYKITAQSKAIFLLTIVE
ncbi:MAG: hypothetical protein H0W12_11340 [Chitinophagaceae bacterium]|nr:hypothetical protein [Chitinophagaceae bacterium]